MHLKAIVKKKALINSFRDVSKELVYHAEKQTSKNTEKDAHKKHIEKCKSYIELPSAF